jgi:hypothetical protein
VDAAHAFTGASWKAGLGKKSLKPPPVVMIPPVLEEHATSAVPLSGPCVAPTDTT